MREVFNTLARKAGKVLTIAALALGVSFGAAAQDDYPFPTAPKSFPESVYQGQQGCIPDDNHLMFAVMMNEGMYIAGTHPLFDAPETGVHIMNLVYNPEKNYGYTLSFKNEGSLCVYNKLNDMKFKDELTNVFSTVAVKPPITAKDCNFDVKAVNLCGSYKAVTGRLGRAGYLYDWQGTLEGDYKLTMMTKDQQSFYLKTDNSTGATIITGVGKGAYRVFDQPKLKHPRN